MPSEDDRRKRLIAFVVITLTFIVSVAALLYWAINVATARINSRITAHFQGLNPFSAVLGEKATTASVTSARPNNCIMTWQIF